MRGLLRGMAVLAAWLVIAPAALAAPPSIVVEDAVTQPVFGCADAIRERVWVDAGTHVPRRGARRADVSANRPG